MKEKGRVFLSVVDLAAAITLLAYSSAQSTDSDHDDTQTHEDGLDLEQAASELFGYAFDGYPIYGSADADGSVPDDLDECNGHTAATADYPEGVYHYHASLEFPNLPSCLVGVSAQDAFRTNASGGVGAPGGGPGN